MPDHRRFVSILVLHVVASWFMTGLIWFVQIVHYPLLADIPHDAFVAYETRNTRNTAWVVLPPMLIELATAAWLAFRAPSTWRHTGQSLLGLTAAIWIATILVHIPQHESLSVAFSPDVHESLVRTNWGRTLLWSLKAVLATRIMAPLCLPGGAQPGRR